MGRGGIFVSLLFISFSAYADQLIIEPDMGRQPILDAINNSQHSIDLVMYGFTDKTLLNALIEKKNQGKTVKVILEESPYKSENENNKAIAAFNANNLTWQGHIPPFRLIHQKTLVVDDKKALVMTFNFTQSTFRNQRNFALVLDNPKQVNAIAALFSADYNHLPYTNSNPDLIISPDNSRDQLLSLLNHAKSSVKIYAQNINDYKIVGALAKAALRSVNIQIVTSNRMREKQLKYLQHAGVNIHYSKKLIIHAKVFIIDNQKAVIGSINLTRASLDDNRELSVITQDRTVIQQLNNTFAHDWNGAPTNHINNLMPDKKQIKRFMNKLNKFVNESL